jgi:hypothetical protein
MRFANACHDGRPSCVTPGAPGSPVRAGCSRRSLSSTSVLRADRLQKMPGSSAFDALRRWRVTWEEPCANLRRDSF